MPPRSQQLQDVCVRHVVLPQFRSAATMRFAGTDAGGDVRYLPAVTVPAPYRLGKDVVAPAVART